MMTILIHFLLSLGAVFGFCSIFKITSSEVSTETRIPPIRILETVIQSLPLLPSL